MCGRGRVKVPFSILQKILRFEPLTPDEQERWDRQFDGEIERPEIRPTNPIPVLRLGDDGKRRVDLLRWGLVPAWTKELKDVRSTFNARVETAATKPTFRSAWKARHCLVVVDGIYEWTGEGKARRPNLVHVANEAPFGIAGLWETWTDKATGEIVESCTMLIREPEGFFKSFHDRMPIVLPDGDAQDAWLDPARPDSFGALEHYVTDWSLVPLPDGIPRNDNEIRVEPIASVPAEKQMKLFG
jgi:putative SOS response-associated peptidase YedK